jgi:hypothetical protein
VSFRKEKEHKSLFYNFSRLTVRPLWTALVIMLIIWLIILPSPPAFAASASDNAAAAYTAKKLNDFCADPRMGLDIKAAGILVDYVLGPKANKEAGLPEIEDSPGAYYEFDTNISFSRFLNYAYNLKIPPNITEPSSMRFSTWSSLQGKAQNMQDKWKPAKPNDDPTIIHGLQHDCITPGSQHRSLLRIRFETDPHSPQLQRPAGSALHFQAGKAVRGRQEGSCPGQ